MYNHIKYYIGVDGGGTGTRAIICDQHGNVLSKSHGAPSALSLGIDNAWKSILDSISEAFFLGNISVPMLSECAIGLGMSGANNIIWKNKFLLKNPGFKIIHVETDGYTTLIGAHQNKPGSIVALGTGSIGLLLKKDGSKIYVSGWGYPTGDEASGSWLGMKAINLAEKTIDKRVAPSKLSQLILNHCGDTEEALLNWLANANQNDFAKLAPFVFEAANEDPFAKQLLLKAGREVESMLYTLDPKLEYPFSICGRLGEALLPFLPEQIQKHHNKAFADSSYGAFLLIKK